MRIASKQTNCCLTILKISEKKFHPLPEVKYYDDEIRHVKVDIKELFKLC